MTDRRYAIGDGYAGKAAALGERCLTDRRYAIGDGYAGKAAALGERSVADRRYARGDFYAGKSAATVERVAADRRYACGDFYAGKVATILERITGNTGKLAFRRKSYAGNGGIRSKRVDFRNRQVIAVIEPVGGYMYRADCRSPADAVGSVAVDSLKAQARRAGGIFAVKAGFFEVRRVIFTRYRLYAVFSFGGGGYGCIAFVPVMDVRKVIRAKSFVIFTVQFVIDIHHFIRAGRPGPPAFGKLDGKEIITRAHVSASRQWAGPASAYIDNGVVLEIFQREYVYRRSRRIYYRVYEFATAGFGVATKENRRLRDSAAGNGKYCGRAGCRRNGIARFGVGFNG